MTAGLTWGAVLPHGGAGEFEGWDGGRAWARLREAAVHYENLGFDHLWTSDHLMSERGDRTGPYFESYTVLAALTQVTERAKLGVLVTCAQYRNVAILAKQAANIAVLSGGRFIFSLGAGWDESEFAAFGLRFPDARERATVFAETLDAVTQLWSQESVTFDGEFVKLAGASCSPRPPLMPEIWTGVSGPRGLAVAARLADVANWNCALDQFVQRSEVLAAASTGRTVERSVFRLGGRLDALRRFLADRGAPPELAEQVAADHFIGEVPEVVSKVRSFVDAGARHLVTMFLGDEETFDAANSFASEVIPAVTGSRPLPTP